MDSKRKEYLQKYKKRRQQEINEYQRNYYKRNKDKYREKYNRPFDENNPNSKNCKTGRFFELVVASLLPDSIDNNIKSFRGKWDLVWQGKTIEVKSRLVRAGFYMFSIKNPGVPDLYAFVCRKDVDLIEKILLVPGDLVKSKSFVIKSGSTPLNKYRLYRGILNK